MNEIFTVAGLAVVSSGIAVLLKQYKPEYAFGAVFAFGIIIMLYIIGFFREIFELLQNLVSFSGIKESNFEIILKCSGICLVTKIASDSCKDCGNESVSSKVELAGKALMILCAVPLMEEIMELIKIFMEI
ncbi:MAG: hypothetical protein IJA92_07810 [Oscillospiraceae bacterium]|nr:hypothetical protein [Oscillospiraceae bacterium]